MSEVQGLPPLDIQNTTATTEAPKVTIYNATSCCYLCILSINVNVTSPMELKLGSRSTEQDFVRLLRTDRELIRDILYQVLLKLLLFPVLLAERSFKPKILWDSTF